MSKHDIFSHSVDRRLIVILPRFDLKSRMVKSLVFLVAIAYVALNSVAHGLVPSPDSQLYNQIAFHSSDNCQTHTSSKGVVSDCDLAKTSVPDAPEDMSKHCLTHFNSAEPAMASYVSLTGRKRVLFLARRLTPLQPNSIKKPPKFFS